MNTMNPTSTSGSLMSLAHPFSTYFFCNFCQKIGLAPACSHLPPNTPPIMRTKQILTSPLPHYPPHLLQFFPFPPPTWFPVCTCRHHLSSPSCRHWWGTGAGQPKAATTCLPIAGAQASRTPGLPLRQSYGNPRAIDLFTFHLRKSNACTYVSMQLTCSMQLDCRLHQWRLNRRHLRSTRQHLLHCPDPGRRCCFFKHLRLGR